MPLQSTIAVVGGDPARRAELVRLLEACGLAGARAVGALSELREAPDALILAPGDHPTITIGMVRDDALWVDVPIIAVAPAVPQGAAAVLLAAGADEVVSEPVTEAVLGARVRNLMRRSAAERRVRELDRVQDAQRRIRATFSGGGDAPEALREVMIVATSVLGCDRGALIAHVESSDLAYVIAATDDPTLSQFVLSAHKYPELAAATRTGEPVLIADTLDDPITIDVAQHLRARGVRALAVFPCFWRGRALGGLLFRKEQPGLSHLTPARIEFGVALASQVAAQLRDSRVVERLTENTRRISRASYEAERRLRTIESLKEHFEASADGVAVLDEEGRILFLNGVAESITGFARDGLIGSPLVDLVPDDQRAPLEEVIRSVLGGTNLEAFDLELSTTSGEPITVSVTTSTVLARSSAVILSFRDVTAERALEAELSQTKDFLEKLIDSAVDAIIAADMHGRVLLFNPGAEHVFGHRAEDVIGRLPVWQLYPEGGARRIMQMLRSPEGGGVGRLEQTQIEILTRDGELVPVNMTASIIYEGGREAATVGILSDLRERLRMEEQLLYAQEQLEQQERQAMVAQLAGAAAHELNQPLTSILGYAQLMERMSEPDAPHARPLQIILREVTRMADIVRKIGRITRYEVKEYVGSASIMDIEKSAASSGEMRAAGGELEGDETGEITVVARDPDALAVEVEVESADEEITAQHLIVSRPAAAEGPGGDEPTREEPTREEPIDLPPLPAGTEISAAARDARAGGEGPGAPPRPGETADPATDRIVSRDASAPKR
ncbi:MAG TPA: PAS domain S-box protein [Kofleriaceae bacterium]|nr:PAS domain S-box protein [Kofleriaceae bacterium]